MFKFENIWLLTLLGLVPIGILFYMLLQRWKQKTRARLGDKWLIDRLTAEFSSRKFLLKSLLAGFALVLLILAAANPQTRSESGPQHKKGLDVMILLDVSKSMLAQDIKPTRLDRAKLLVSQLIDNLGDNRLGLIWFAGRAYLQMPLTTDLAAAKLYLQNAGPDAVPTQGTVIGEALRMAGSAFNNKDKKYKAVILISDGEDHDPEALRIVKDLAGSGVMINTVGIGSPEGATIFDPATNDTKKDAEGNTVITKLNEAQLRELAQTGNGIYVYLQDATAAAASLRSQLAGIEKKDLEDESFAHFNTYYYYLVGLALLLLLAELLLPERIRQKKADAIFVSPSNSNK
ncbi:VWA domain-containing protein [Flavihumibacter petaseus]|uniref:VWFA domain-containing protein n=1 Tax=Flavihumibacter petaseus NBRC 106054 TaxID=1220578 RepID=A0A0E9N623_9BACT|nr:VWA domain-containing protein [Flavihumibacter petaseus]GAO45279.1 hypothetical protein FPE01S_04_05230 [Flavihumibacter petaseus NBRC 106054]